MNHITPVTTTVRTLYNIILSSITENISHFNSNININTFIKSLLVYS